MTVVFKIFTVGPVLPCPGTPGPCWPMIQYPPSIYNVTALLNPILAQLAQNITVAELLPVID